MARDAYLSRLLTRLVAAAAGLLVAACQGAGVDAPRREPSTDGSRLRQSAPAGQAASRASQQREAEASHPDQPPALDDAAASAALSRAAWARLRWPGGDTLAANLADRLDEPVHAGSIFKLVVARAALAQGRVTSDTRMACPRRVEVRGRRVDCVHPDLGRPLALDDALAHSCNHFFVELAGRLDRAGVASVLQQLSGGAIVLTGEAPLPLVVLGLDGPRAGMGAWARVAAAAMAHDPAHPDGSALVRRGVTRAVSEGTAAALAETTMLTLAKTGTTMPGGAAQEGRVVAWRPEIGEVMVVRAPGVPGRDAARLARAVWDAAAARDEPRVRVGRVREATGEADASRAPSEVEGARRPDALPVVEAVPLEAYVAGVVAAEGEPDMPSVASQALAIAARSYAQAPGRRHAGDGYEVCDTTHCQVFGAATRWSRDAAERTRGMVLARGSTTVAVPYSASCSGALSSPRDLWGGADQIVTRAGPDPADHPVTVWRGEVRADALLAALREAGHRGDHLRDVRIAARTRAGVPSRIALDGLAPAEIDASTFRHLVGRRLGWDVLKSHAWEVTRSGGGYRFTGRGKGHGAGLCLRGASGLAARGATLTQVLATYAPGATLRAAQDRVRLRVPSVLAAEAPRLRSAILAQLAELRHRLAITAPRDVAIEVYPTRGAYQRATGRAWWTSASTRHIVGDRYRVDLAPPADARSVPALLAVLRHEAIHVLTVPALADGPAWAAEGLAQSVSEAGIAGIHTASQGGTARRAVLHPALAAPCPSDTEVTRPGSLDAMRDVYARAAACVAAALPTGIANWRILAIVP